MSSLNTGRSDALGPYSLDVLKSIPLPQLFKSDASAWKSELVKWFEEQTQRTLYPMQIEMLLIETLAYAMSVLGQEGQMAIEQHLVATAGLDGLVGLGANRSTPRLPAAAALVTLRFSIAETQVASVFIPAGTRVAAGGDFVFKTKNAAHIGQGQLSVDVGAVALELGAGGNGFLPGQISTLLAPIDGVSVANVTESSGGADIEDVELYRLRLANAFERISTGGSFAWYKETALGVSSALIDVAIVRPQPCFIEIYPLTATGAASLTLRGYVYDAFNTADALDIRFGDDVTVKPPVAVTAAPTITVRVRGASSTIQTQAQTQVNAILAKWRRQLGAMVAPSEIEAAVRTLAGVVDVSVSNLNFIALGAHEYLVCTSVTINIEVLP